jgi:hypothetical protein
MLCESAKQAGSRTIFGRYKEPDSVRAGFLVRGRVMPRAPCLCRQSRSYSKRSGGRQLSATAAPREEMRTMVTAPRPPRTPMRGRHSSFQKSEGPGGIELQAFQLSCSRLCLIALSFPRAASEFREWKKCAVRRAVPKNPPSLFAGGRQGTQERCCMLTIANNTGPVSHAPNR